VPDLILESLCSSDQRSSGLLTKIAAAVRALCVLEQAVAAAAFAPPERVRPAWHLLAKAARCRRIPGYFAGIPGEFRVLPGIFLKTAEKSPNTTTNSDLKGSLKSSEGRWTGYR